MKACVIGTGYVGLVTSACLALVGHEVMCVATTAEEMMSIQGGQYPSFEPGLEAIVQAAVMAKQLTFTADLGQGVRYGEVIILAMAPTLLMTGDVDTRLVETIVRNIGTHLAPLKDVNKVIVNRFPVSTQSGNWIRQIILDETSRQQIKQSDSEGFMVIFENFAVVNNPVPLRQGKAVYDTLNPKHVILGSDSEWAIATMQTFYAPLLKSEFAQDSSQAVSFIITDLSAATVKKPNLQSSSLQVA